MANIGTFERIDDNTIRHTYTRWRIAKVDEMWQRADAIVTQLNEMPSEKTLDDKEAEQVYNDYVEQERKEIPSLVEGLQWIVYWAGEAEKQGVLTDSEKERLQELNEILEKYQ